MKLFDFYLVIIVNEWSGDFYLVSKIELCLMKFDVIFKRVIWLWFSCVDVLLVRCRYLYSVILFSNVVSKK